MGESLITKSAIKRYFHIRIENQQKSYSHPSYSMELKLNHYITKGEKEEAIKVLDKINQLERANLAADQIRSLKNSLICSCTLFTRAAIKGGAQFEDTFNLSDAYIQQIENLTTKDDLVKLEYEMVSSFIDKAIEGTRPKYNYIVNKAIAYIHEEILSELSLETVAKENNVNPSYLSKLFKQTVGLSLTNFIAKSRIEESTYFLLHSKISISEISQIFKFCNQSYYSSLFKHYKGMTPKKYRDLYADLNEDLNGDTGEV